MQSLIQVNSIEIETNMPKRQRQKNAKKTETKDEK